MELESIKKILATLRLSEGLKRELRHSWLSDGRQESVAEHTFQMALMAVFMAPQLEEKVNLERTLKMILVHDLVEAISGDVPFFEIGDRKAEKSLREKQAIETIRDMLPPATGQEIHDCWFEFEQGASAEAKFARALDNLEVQLQHNMADLGTWTPIEHELVYTKMDTHCRHDNFLAGFCTQIKHEAEQKMVLGGIDVLEVKKRAGLRTHAG